jgi:hypothetical protein
MITCPHCGKEIEETTAGIVDVAQAHDRADLLLRYTETQIDWLDALIDEFRKTRKSGKLADSVVLKELDYWSKFDVPVVMAAIDRYNEYDCAAQGKGEKYFRGILRGIAREQDKPMKRKPHKRRGESIQDGLDRNRSDVASWLNG